MAVAFRAPRQSNVLRLRAPIVQRAWYSESSGLTKEAIESRVLDVLKSFEKVDPAKVSNPIVLSIQGSRQTRYLMSSSRRHQRLPMTLVLIVWTQSRLLWQLKRSVTPYYSIVHLLT